MVHLADGDDGSVYTLSSALPDYTSQLGSIRRAPFRAAKDNRMMLGDARLTAGANAATVQQEALRAVAQAAAKV
jgi:hypothetical protein